MTPKIKKSDVKKMLRSLLPSKDVDGVSNYPSSPSPKEVIFDTQAEALKVWDGSSWVEVAP